MEQNSNLTAFEVETLIENLKRFRLDEVGSLKWFNQHQTLERLNITAHTNLMQQSEEFISEAFITFQMIETLIHDLVLIQTWKRLIYPKIDKNAIYENSVSSYFVLYHEATTLNLLQVIMYHPSACKDAGDAILDLLNAIKPKMTSLINWKHSPPKQKIDVESLMKETAQETFEASLRDMEFAMAMCSLGIFRTITDSVQDLALSAVKNMLIQDDMVVILVYLIQSAPWLRKKSNEKFEKFEVQNWVNISEEDLMLVTPLEGQVWLALMNLLLEKEPRNTYQYCKKNQSIVLGLKDCITEELVDQIPPLVDLQRYLEELLMLQAPETVQPSFGITPISEIYTRITENIAIDEIAAAQTSVLQNLTEKQKQAVTSDLAQVYNFENFSEVLGESKCAACGKGALQRCSRCRQEWYCSRACQVGAWKDHKSICDVLSSAK